MLGKPKKVLFVVTKSGLGGASRYVLELVEALKSDYSVAVAAGESGGGHKGGLFERCSDAGVRTIPIPHLERDISIVKELRVFFFFLSLFKNEKPDVVHLNSPKAGGLGALAARLSGVPRIIYTAHGWAFFEDLPWWNLALRKVFSYITVLLAHRSIAVSSKDARAFRAWPFTRNKIIHIPIGITVHQPQPKEDSLRQLGLYDISYNSSNILIGTIGELHKNKGFEYLIDAAKEVPGATFIIIGEGEERSRLEQKIKASHLESRVLLRGYVSDAHQYIDAFDVFVMPSVKEGLPFVLLEAGAHGMPVVAANAGGIPDIIENEKTGLLVPPKNSTALAQALMRLQNDSQLCVSLGLRLKEVTKQRFSFDRMLRQTTTLY